MSDRDRQFFPVGVPRPASESRGMSVADALKRALGVLPSEIPELVLPCPVLPGTAHHVDPEWLASQLGEQEQTAERFVACTSPASKPSASGEILGVIGRLSGAGGEPQISTANRAWFTRSGARTVRWRLLPWVVEEDGDAAREILPVLVEEVTAYALQLSTRPDARDAMIGLKAREADPSLYAYLAVSWLTANPALLQRMLEENDPEQRIHVALDVLDRIDGRAT